MFMMPEYNFSYSRVNNQSDLIRHYRSYSLPRMSGTLAQRLAEAMAKKGLTQETLAKKAGVTQVAIHKILSSKTAATRKGPELAAALGVDLEWLLTGKESYKNRECENDEVKKHLEGIPVNWDLMSEVASIIEEIRKQRRPGGFTREELRALFEAGYGMAMLKRRSEIKNHLSSVLERMAWSASTMGEKQTD